MPVVTPPGYKVFENAVPMTVALSPLVSGWMETTGYTTLLLSAVIANSTGTTTFTIEGSFDGATLDPTMTYTPAVTASTGVAGTAIVVQHTYVRFRIVQATATATTSTFFVQARA
jgi:hypothetical protein